MVIRASGPTALDTSHVCQVIQAPTFSSQRREQTMAFMDGPIALKNKIKLTRKWVVSQRNKKKFA